MKRSAIEARTLSDVKRHGLLDPGENLTALFYELARTFGPASHTPELVIFFKKGVDARLKIDQHRAELIVKKRTDPSRRDAHEVLILPIPLTSAETLIRQFDRMGYSEGLFSPSHTFLFNSPRGRFRLKLNAPTGTFWDFARSLRTPGDRVQVLAEMDALLADLGLRAMEQEDFRAEMDRRWDAHHPQTLLTETGALHPEVARILTEYSHALGFTDDDETLGAILQRTSNDYSASEDAFRRVTGFDLVTPTRLPPYRNQFFVTASVVVPVRGDSHQTLPYTLDSLGAQRLTAEQRKQVEVIVIDDGSPREVDRTGTLRALKRLSAMGFPTNLVQLGRRSGRGIARNVGLQLAAGDVVFFFDADVVVHTEYLREAIVRHQFLDQIALVGFKQNVDLDPKRLKRLLADAEAPDIRQDFRYEKECSPDWIGVHPVQTATTARCLKDTDDFRGFGLGRVVGAFDLPGMFVTHSVSVRRRELEAVGGFDPAFGFRWGYEDTHLGAKLIAIGCKIVPLLSTGVFHIDRPEERRNPSVKRSKHSDLAEVVQTYLRLLNKPFGGNLPRARRLLTDTPPGAVVTAHRVFE